MIPSEFPGVGASETDIVASTTITGNAFRKAANSTYRLGTRPARAFLRDYAALPQGRFANRGNRLPGADVRAISPLVEGMRSGTKRRVSFAYGLRRVLAEA